MTIFKNKINTNTVQAFTDIITHWSHPAFWTEGAAKIFNKDGVLMDSSERYLLIELEPQVQNNLRGSN